MSVQQMLGSCRYEELASLFPSLCLKLADSSKREMKEQVSAPQVLAQVVQSPERARDSGP